MPRVEAVDPALGLLEHAMRDIRSLHQPVKVGMFATELRQHDRQGVGLLAGGRGRGPYPEGRTSGGELRHPIGQQVVLEKREMLRLAEEPGMVGGDEVHQLLDLVRTVPGSQHVAVIVKGIEPECAQPFSQPVGEHGLFVGAEPDMAVLVHQGHQRPVGLGRQSRRERRVHPRGREPSRRSLRSS